MSGSKRVVHSEGAPKAIGPYSQAVVVDGWMFGSGQIGLDPSTGELVGGGVAAQAEQVMRNLAAVLQAAGAGFEQVVKTTIFLADMADFATVNEVYGRRFSGTKPARSTVAAKTLPKGALVEVDFVARL